MDATGIPVTSWCYAYRKEAPKTIYRFFTREDRDLWISVAPTRVPVIEGSELHRSIVHQETLLRRDWSRLHPALKISIRDGEVPRCDIPLGLILPMAEKDRI